MSKCQLVSRSSIYAGDAKNVLKTFKSKRFQTVITSPPYWGLRDSFFEGEIGAEQQLKDYLNNLSEVFQDVHRVMKDSGVLWLNIGDVYSNGNRKYRAPDKKNPARGMANRPCDPPGIGPKNLIGLPWRIAFLLQEIGFIVRSEIIWHKWNCMPESVKDRPIRRHEHIFMFSKNPSYYYDGSALKTEGFDASGTVWRNPVRPSIYSGHSSTFPENLMEPCINASSKHNQVVLDPFAGTLTVARACNRLGRRFVGVEINRNHIHAAQEAGDFPMEVIYS